MILKMVGDLLFVNEFALTCGGHKDESKERDVRKRHGWSDITK